MRPSKPAHHSWLILAWLVLGCLAALILPQPGESSPQDPRSSLSTPQIYNLGVQVDIPSDLYVGTNITIGPNLVSWFTTESDLQRDLNGDGDLVDGMLFVHDRASGLTSNLGLATAQSQYEPQIAQDGDILAFRVFEKRQGGMDLNGDGDATDAILHIYDGATGILTNLGIEASQIAVRGNFVIFNQLHPGRDIMVYNVLESTTTSFPSFTGRRLTTTDQLVVGRANEFTQGDLNGDGDELDAIVQVYDFLSETLFILGLAAPDFAVYANGHLAAFGASEYLNGGMDLNGDGDFTDEMVAHVFDRRTGNLTNLEIATSAPFVSFPYRVGDELVAFAVQEISHGETDLNGDGDIFDTIGHVYDARTGQTKNLALPVGSWGLGVGGDLVAIQVDEGDNGETDLNGDGDANDIVLHLYDATSGVTRNLGLAVARPSSGSRDPVVSVGRLIFVVSENDQNESDLNGDGDTTDGVVHIFDSASGEVTNVGLAVRLSMWYPNNVADGSLFSLRVGENAQARTDLNGDGDTMDNVLHLYDATDGSIFNTGLTIRGTVEDPVLGFGAVAFAVTERNQGNMDLDGDGRTTGDVVHLIELEPRPTPCAAGTVNLGNGPTTPVLKVNGIPANTVVPVDSPIEFSLGTAPLGPSPATYLLWVWVADTLRPFDLQLGTRFLGCTANPTYLNPLETPQPFRCIRSSNLPGGVCGQIPEISGPARAPWSLQRNRGPFPLTIVVQGILEDAGADNQTGYSVTNAVVVEFF